MAVCILGVLFGLSAIAASFVWAVGETGYPVRAFIITIVLGACSAVCIYVSTRIEKAGVGW